MAQGRVEALQILGRVLFQAQEQVLKTEWGLWIKTKATARGNLTHVKVICLL